MFFQDNNHIFFVFIKRALRYLLTRFFLRHGQIQTILLFWGIFQTILATSSDFVFILLFVITQRPYITPYLKFILISQHVSRLWFIMKLVFLTKKNVNYSFCSLKSKLYLTDKILCWNSPTKPTKYWLYWNRLKVGGTHQANFKDSHVSDPQQMSPRTTSCP